MCTFSRDKYFCKSQLFPLNLRFTLTVKLRNPALGNTDKELTQIKPNFQICQFTENTENRETC